MSGKVKVTLLKPLDGRAIGDTMNLSEADFERLEKRGAVKVDAPAKKKKTASRSASEQTEKPASAVAADAGPEADASGTSA